MARRPNRGAVWCPSLADPRCASTPTPPLCEGRATDFRLRGHAPDADRTRAAIHTKRSGRGLDADRTLAASPKAVAKYGAPPPLLRPDLGGKDVLCCLPRIVHGAYAGDYWGLSSPPAHHLAFVCCLQKDVWWEEEGLLRTRVCWVHQQGCKKELRLLFIFVFTAAPTRTSFVVTLASYWVFGVIFGGGGIQGA
eukprot:gene14674-biopygen5136